MTSEAQRTPRRLYLVRHAKSSWKDPTLDDFDRPLNKRGKRDAPMMGKRFANDGLYPDLIVSSPANRAFTTAKIVARALGYPRANIVREDTLYLADVAGLLSTVRNTDASVWGLMLFGHNPGFTEFANALCDTAIDNVPTCGLVAADLDVESWDEVRLGEATLVTFDYPKHVRD